ncbi:MAG: flagellar filament capping protein FliD [Bryobacteraceae bacterium]
MSTTSATPPSSSSYSSDLQQVLSRSIAIASIPLTQLNSTLTDMQNRSAELNTVNGKFSAVQSAIQSISTAVSSTNAQVSDSGVIAAQSDPTASAGSYSIHVVTAGSSSSALSLNTLPAVQDPSTQSISTSTSFTLTVDGTPVTITPTANTLSALADAINSSGANVAATIVNLGSPSAPSYQLSLQSTKLGNITLQLNDGTNDLMGTLSAGAEAQYQVNGNPATPISSDSSTVIVAPGVTVDLLNSGDSTVTVSQSSVAQSNALSSFATAYNAAVNELNVNRGQGGGALTGDALIYTLSQSLRDISGFTGGSGSVQNLTDIGLTFDQNGHLNFDQTVFASAAAAHPTDLSAFLGSPATGGFLKGATDTMNGLGDPITGVLETTIASAQTAIDNQNQKISNEQDRITTLTTSLTSKIDAADALIASLEQQQTYFTTLFTDMNAINKNQG